MSFQLEYSKYNSNAILINWPSIIDENILEDILKFKLSIQKNYIELKVEVINTYSSLLVIYNSIIDNINGEILTLKAIYSNQISDKKFKLNTWEIPVCYDLKFATDLEELSIHKQLSKTEIITLHSRPFYTVFFIGFLPGFLYLGGLDSKLFIDRKSTPNLNVKKGSIAIGGEQTGIYPQDSPGGWHIIGNSPIELVNPNENPPCKISAGDKVKFSPVDLNRYEEILFEIKNGSYHLKAVMS